MIDRALIERWALHYLDRYASSAENLRRVLLRRVRRRAGGDGEAERAAAPLIDTLIGRYREAGLLDDAAYAAARAKSGVQRGQSLHRIAQGLRAKGIASDDTASAVEGLRDGGADPELAAACAFARRRRLGPFRRARLAPGGRRQELAAFARAGFARGVADVVLGCADEAAIAALLADSAS